MAWIERGKKWPRNAEEYPRHPDWLTIREAAALLGCGPQSVTKLITRQKTLPAIKKEWRYGCWVRRALFVKRADIERIILYRTARRLPKGHIASLIPIRVLALNPLREWRRANNLTALETAGLLGVTEAAIARWEHGWNDPGDDTLSALADMMAVEISDLRMRWTAWRVMTLAPRPQREKTELNFERQHPTRDGKTASATESAVPSQSASPVD